MSFRRKVIELFPFASSMSLLCFSVLIVSYFNDHDMLVGGLAIAFGALAIAGIMLTPTRKDAP